MASSSKMKLSVSEVNSARNKLNGVLQTLKQKVEDSTSTSDSSEDDTYSFPSRVKKEMAAQTKRGGKAPRKRRRKDDGDSKDASYVMKLFDRSVDLAKFSVTSPLYPICRAWMINEPHVSLQAPKTDVEVVNVEDEAQNEDTEEEQCVTVLPSPLKIPKVEDYYYQDLRIPSPMPSPEKLDIDENAAESPSKEVLLSNHLLRWKEVRQKWRESSFMNEERYRDSIGIIKSLKVVFE